MGAFKYGPSGDSRWNTMLPPGCRRIWRLSPPLIAPLMKRHPPTVRGIAAAMLVGRVRQVSTRTKSGDTDSADNLC